MPLSVQEDSVGRKKLPVEERHFAPLAFRADYVAVNLPRLHVARLERVVRMRAVAVRRDVARTEEPELSVGSHPRRGIGEEHALGRDRIHGRTRKLYDVAGKSLRLGPQHTCLPFVQTDVYERAGMEKRMLVRPLERFDGRVAAVSDCDDVAALYREAHLVRRIRNDPSVCIHRLDLYETQRTRRLASLFALKA